MLEAINDEDVLGIVSLMNRAYRGSSAALSWNSEADYITGDRTSEQVIRNDMQNRSGGAFLKLMDEESKIMLGCVWLQNNGSDQWYLGSLTTEPDRQGAGLGSKLLSLSEDWIQNKGGKVIKLTVVNLREPLIAWYVRRGYSLTGESEPFPYGDDRFGIPKRPDLSFLVMQKTLEVESD